MLLEIIEECNYQNWKNGERRHITIQRSTKKESKGGMTRESWRRSSHPEIRYYFLIPGWSFSGMEDSGANGKVINSSSHGAITLQNSEGTLFKVNGQRLKLFLEPNEEFEEIDVVHFTFPWRIRARYFWSVVLGHIYIFLNNFASRNTLGKVGP